MAQPDPTALAPKINCHQGVDLENASAFESSDKLLNISSETDEDNRILHDWIEEDTDGQETST